jgi:predicted transcriptional regulator
MKVVLSIKPQFANKIFDGTKKFEFRKAIFKNQNVTSVLVYASSPVQKVIGEFEIGEIFNFDLKTLWDKTKEHSGITEDYFYEYFENREHGFAIQIKNQVRFTKPKCLREDYDLTPPQSFAYWNSKE